MTRSTLVAAVFVVLALATPALAAYYVCHPDPTGTRTVQLRGHVVGYAVHGETVTIAVRHDGRCSTFAWRAARALASGSRSCASVAGAPRSAPDGVRIVRPGAGIDRPNRLVVLATGRSWPLPVRVRPHTLQVSGDLAAYGALGDHGLWVTRLSDGRTTFVAPVKADDRPLLTAGGTVYVDDVYKHAPAMRPLVKFVPTAALESELARVGAPVHTGGAIRAFSMDGTRMALVVAGGTNGCDRVVFWNVPWRSVEQISQQAGVTCAASGASHRISQIALGGARAQWVTTQYGKPIVVAADDIGCQEWVVGRLIAPPVLAADGTMVAFSLPGRSSSSIEVVGKHYRSSDLYGLSGRIHGLAADGRRTAVLDAGRVTIHDARAMQQTFRVRGGRALALRGPTVVTTTSSGRLDVFRSGQLLHSWPLPASAAPQVDLQYGIAVVSTRGAVYAVDIANGRTARLASTPATPHAQIEAIGVGYTYSLGNRGTASLIPMGAVEAMLGRSG